MRITFLLTGIAVASLMISGIASANYQGRSQGKGRGNSAAHSQKANKSHKHARAENEGAWRAPQAATRCPPGLAKKNNGCVAPGLAKKRFAQGDRLPAAFRSNNVPAAYADQYRDTSTSLYRYSSGSVYRIDRASRRIAEVISVPTL